MTQQIDHAAAMEQATRYKYGENGNLSAAYLAHTETIRELQARVKSLEELIVDCDDRNTFKIGDVADALAAIKAEAKAIQQRERRNGGKA
jgi:hypothetical protein